MGMREEEYELKAKVYWRSSTNEWVLEISGAINDTRFISRHTQPESVSAENVAGLPHLYAEIEAASLAAAEKVKEEAARVAAPRFSGKFAAREIRAIDVKKLLEQN